jgi:hypothetical protein
MIIVFGFRTPAQVEVPKVLYLGDDGDEAMRIADESDYPRVATARNPQLLNRRHWDEAASTAFEEAHGAELGPPQVTSPIGEFTVEEAPQPESDGDASVLTKEEEAEQRFFASKV